MPVDSPDGTGGSLRLQGNNFSERLRVALLHCNNRLEVHTGRSGTARRLPIRATITVQLRFSRAQISKAVLFRIRFWILLRHRACRLSVGEPGQYRGTETEIAS